MRYLIFNKPCGVLSQFTDEGIEHPTQKQYINWRELTAGEIGLLKKLKFMFVLPQWSREWLKGWAKIGL